MLTGARSVLMTSLSLSTGQQSAAPNVRRAGAECALALIEVQQHTLGWSDFDDAAIADAVAKAAAAAAAAGAASVSKSVAPSSSSTAAAATLKAVAAARDAVCEDGDGGGDGDSGATAAGDAGAGATLTPLAEVCPVLALACGTDSVPLADVHSLAALFGIVACCISPIAIAADYEGLRCALQQRLVLLGFSHGYMHPDTLLCWRALNEVLKLC